MSDRARVDTFNSPLETGIRSLCLLVSSYPKSFDIQRLLELDYLLIHSADAGGPESLHPPVPLRRGELLIRRELIEKGLLLMMSRNLVERIPCQHGIEYLASDEAASFVAGFQSHYLKQLQERADWVAKSFGESSSEDVKQLISKICNDWSVEFQPDERSYGAADQ